MSKILFAISLMSLLACGSGESNPGATDSALDTAPVSAEAPAGDAMEPAKTEKMKAIEDVAAPEGE
jgi:hypothetical protein